MGILTADMKRVVGEQRLGFVATVCPDGTPNLSPKGTTAVWDDDHLVFANIRSPNTLANLRANASVEVNVVDPFVRKGYRFKGTASVLESGPLYDEMIAVYRRQVSSTIPIHEVVMVRVQRAQPIDSPAYDTGLSEDEVRAQWERHFDSLRAKKPTPPTGGWPTITDGALAALLAELERFAAENDAATNARARRMLNITRDTGEFLAVLVRATAARRVLEIGTSNGYSTLWLAAGAREIDGAVVTVELAADKVALAAANFERSGLGPIIELVHDEAGRVLQRSEPDAYDLV